MLTNTNEATYSSSMSKPSEALAESCSPSKLGLPALKKPGQKTMISGFSVHVEAAQKLIAEMAVRIMKANRRQVDE